MTRERKEKVKKLLTKQIWLSVSHKFGLLAKTGLHLKEKLQVMISEILSKGILQMTGKGM